MPHELDDLDRAIINVLQSGFPVCEYPFREVAEQLDVGEDELIARVARLLKQRVLTRFGPLYNADRMGGAFTLAALSVARSEVDRVAAILDGLPEVAHNYEREHAWNLWFVLATDSPEGIEKAIARIQAETGHPVLNLPKEREYFVELKLRA
jgi:DNA-binding Lrp family transcriptional regulator